MNNQPLAPLLERLTGQARRGLMSACREAHANQDDYLGTEHLLMGLLHEPDTGATQLLQLLNADPERMLRQIRVLLEGRSPGGGVPRLPLTPRAKRALHMAAEEADRARQSYIGTEHLLIALCREEESLAHFLLDQFEVTVNQLRSSLARLPPSENRDRLVLGTGRAGATAVRVDPTLAELTKLLAEEPAVASTVDIASLRRRPAAGMMVAPAGQGRQLTSLRILLGLFIGTTAGVALGSLGIMIVCMIAGAGVGALGRSSLGAVGGAAAGLTLASALCQGRMIEGLLLILVAILAGACLGDGPSRLLAGNRLKEPHNQPEP